MESRSQITAARTTWCRNGGYGKTQSISSAHWSSRPATSLVSGESAPVTSS